MIKELILENRTARRYQPEYRLTEGDLSALVDCARLCASAANLQRLRFALITGERADKAFYSVSLGGYLPIEERPTYDERAAAYIVILTESEPDTNLAIDIGIAAEAITLAAAEAGLGACMIRNFKREEISSLIESDLLPELVISLGKSAQRAIITEAADSIRYYTNDKGENVVPKRPLSQLIVK